MNRKLLILAFLAIPVGAAAQVISYETTSFPEDEGWTRYRVAYEAERWLDDGGFVQLAEPVQPPSGPTESEQDWYVTSLGAFAGSDSFFIQWRMITDGPNSAIPSASPSVLSAGGFSGVLYHTTIAEDRVRFLRDASLPMAWADINPAAAHTYRVELRSSQSYVFFVDGIVIDSGMPEGSFPGADSTVTFGCNAPGEPATTKWEYIRYGVIPQPHSGDYDSDGDVDHDDLYFFTDCLLGPSYDASGPGCTWADMNSDGKADGADIQQFTTAMLAG